MSDETRPLFPEPAVPAVMTGSPVERRDLQGQGAILRAALDQIKADAEAAGKTTAIVAVFDGEGVEVGMARIDPGEGWDITAGVRASVKQGRLSGVSVRVTLMK